MGAVQSNNKLKKFVEDFLECYSPTLSTWNSSQKHILAKKLQAKHYHSLHMKS